MIRTLTEIEAMALKAARGAGMPIGHAEDFATAVRFLAGTSPTNLSEVTTALRGNWQPVMLENDNVIAASSTPMAAPLAIDLMLCGQSKVVLEGVETPAFLHAFVAVACDTRGLVVDVHHAGARITLLAATEVEILKAGTAPVDVDSATWTAWESYAHHTYVPATEASRLAGAGAGLTDND